MGKTSQDFYKNPDKYLLKLENRIEKYNKSLDKDLLKKAYYFSFNRHLFQLRDSGDPYAYHPYEVAKILAELKFDPSIFENVAAVPLAVSFNVVPPG